MTKRRRRTAMQELKCASGVPFNLAEFVGGQAAPLVVVHFYNAECENIGPLFGALAAASAPYLGCFGVNVDESEEVAVAAEITKLPTFIFYTTKLSEDKSSLMVIDKIVGANQKKLRENFDTGYKMVAQFLGAATTAPPPGHPQQTLPP